MLMIFFCLKIVHIAVAAVWMGSSLTVPSDIRRALTLGPPHSSELMPRLRRVARIMNTSALFTLLTGMALAAVEGVAQIPHRIHAGLALTLLAVAAGKWLIRPVIGEIAALAKGPVSSEEVDRIVARFNAANGVEHALRAAVLVLMVYPFTF